LSGGFKLATRTCFARVGARGVGKYICIHIEREREEERYICK